MFTTLTLAAVLLTNPSTSGVAARPPAAVGLINGLLADAEFQLFQAVFPADGSDVITALAPPDFTECIQGALAVCGAGHVCSMCFVDTPHQNICSFICGNPGEPMGCQPQPPCPPTPEPDPGDGEMPTPMPINPED